MNTIQSTNISFSFHTDFDINVRVMKVKDGLSSIYTDVIPVKLHASSTASHSLVHVGMKFISVNLSRSLS